MKKNYKKIKEALNHPDKLGAGAKKRKKLNPDERMEAVMKEHKRGTLRTGSGQHTMNLDEAIAIGLSESGKGKKK